MLGRKRPAATEKTSRAVSLEGSLALKCVFQCFCRDEAVNGRLACKESRFALVWIMRNSAPQRQPATHTDERRGPVGPNFSIMLLRLDVLRQMPTNLAIGDQQSCGYSRKWHQPLRVCKANPPWTRPYRSLVSQ